MNRSGFAMLLFVGVAFAAMKVSALAKDSRTLNVPYAASLNGTPIAPGSYKLSWEAHSPDVTVTFATGKGNNVIATAQGKIVDRGVRYQNNSVVYETKSDGSRAILEIRLAGMTQALVFAEPAS